MTILTVQKALAEDLRATLKDVRLKGIAKENEEPKSKGITVFEDMVPHSFSNNEYDDSFPYVIVRADSGSYVDDESKDNTAKFLLLIGVVDENEEYPVTRDVLMIINRIAERYSKNYILDNRFRRTGDIDWTMSDEDTYPFGFGGIEISFVVPRIEKEDDYC